MGLKQFLGSLIGTLKEPTARAGCVLDLPGEDARLVGHAAGRHVRRARGPEALDSFLSAAAATCQQAQRPSRSPRGGEGESSRDPRVRSDGRREITQIRSAAAHTLTVRALIPF